jgi:23S rRNA (adenine1618-N6)-methyltransferase
MHPNNPFQADYDLDRLTTALPPLKNYLKKSKVGKLTLDFAKPEAVKLLNQALLSTQFKIDFWDIPKNALCPAVPGRLDYLLYLADLFAAENGGEIPKGKDVRILDIGVGANCIYPILAQRQFGWRSVGTDIDGDSLKTANAIIIANGLKKNVELRHQTHSDHIFTGIALADEQFDACICNPPFYASAAEAAANSARKWQKMGRANEYKRAVRNFAGRANELATLGGEKAFVLQMVEESLAKPKLCRWYTSLLAKSQHETPIYQALKRAQVKRIEVIPMGQGNKVSRMIAWQV